MVVVWGGCVVVRGVVLCGVGLWVVLVVGGLVGGWGVVWGGEAFF